MPRPDGGILIVSYGRPEIAVIINPVLQLRDLFLVPAGDCFIMPGITERDADKDSKEKNLKPPDEYLRIEF